MPVASAAGVAAVAAASAAGVAGLCLCAHSERSLARQRANRPALTHAYAALVAELTPMKRSALRKRAREAGVPEAALDATGYSEYSQAAM
eukprot:SAG31_NODE_30192_length_384_cov_1.038596_1_plen_89_part_10